MKRTYVYKGTKISVVINLLRKSLTVEQAASLVRVQPATVKRWLEKYEEEVRQNYL